MPKSRLRLRDIPLRTPLRPAPLWVEVGADAWLLWKITESQPLSTVVLAEVIDLPVDATRRELATLQGLGLVERTGGGWAATGLFPHDAPGAAAAVEAHGRAVDELGDFWDYCGYMDAYDILMEISLENRGELPPVGSPNRYSWFRRRTFEGRE